MTAGSVGGGLWARTAVDLGAHVPGHAPAAETAAAARCCGTGSGGAVRWQPREQALGRGHRPAARRTRRSWARRVGRYAPRPRGTPCRVPRARTRGEEGGRGRAATARRCGWARAARSRPQGSAALGTGSHHGGHTTGCSTSTSLLATLNLVMCGMTAAEQATAMPKRTSTRKREACSFAYEL
eukprot:scaffold66732_cov60-Phaeocystis_antarctica.AAC.2